MKLQIDGAASDLTGREFIYELPAPFGPDKGPAKLSVVLKPASADNVEFREAYDVLLQNARKSDIVRATKFAGPRNAGAAAAAELRDADIQHRRIWEVNFDTCVISWSTNIQSNKKDLEATRENFLELAQFEHEVVRAMFDRMQGDLSDWTQFVSQVDAELLEDQAEK